MLLFFTCRGQPVPFSGRYRRNLGAGLPQGVGISLAILAGLVLQFRCLR